MNDSRILMLTIVTILGTLGMLVTYAQGPPTGRSIMQKVYQAYYYQGVDLRANAHMEITDRRGRKRVREFVLLRLNSDHAQGDQKYYVHFSKPSDIKNMVFMAWKNEARDDDRWLYLPTLDLVRRIAASDERTSFVGSDFFYEDVSGRGLEEDHHERIADEKNHLVIKSTPVKPDQVEFSFYQTWVDKQTSLPMKIEYSNSAGEVYRIYRTLEVSLIDGHQTIVKSKMEHTVSNTVTIVSLSSIRYEQGIPADLFSERGLRRAPKRFLN